LETHKQFFTRVFAWLPAILGPSYINAVVQLAARLGSHAYSLKELKSVQGLFRLLSHPLQL